MRPFPPASARRGGDDEASDSMEEDMRVEIMPELKRHLFVVGQWPKKMLDLALFHCGKVIMDKSTLKVLTVPAKRETMEVSLDIACHGDELDRIGSVKPHELCLAMRRVYTSKGSLCQHLMIDSSIGQVLWAQCAPWQMVSQEVKDGSAEVHVILKNGRPVVKLTLRLSWARRICLMMWGPLRL